MRLPRDLSGADLIKLLCKHFGYRKINQEGSHVILETLDPRQHRISIPDHAPLRVGTLNAILRAVAVAKDVFLETAGPLKECGSVPPSPRSRPSPRRAPLQRVGVVAGLGVSLKHGLVAE